jgi:DNA polymerase III sliding clamp (beta) subunit (PCNA family)
MDNTELIRKKISGFEILKSRVKDPQKLKNIESALKGMYLLLNAKTSKGQTGKGISKVDTKIPSMNISNWSEVPLVWKNTKIPSTLDIDFSDYSNNKSNLWKVLRNYCGEDELRPVMTAIHYDEKSIVATNAHKLIALPNKTKLRGTKPSPNSIKFMGGSIKEIEKDLSTMKYPTYEVVIPIVGEKKRGEKEPQETHIHKVDLAKIKQYCQAAINFANGTTKQGVFKYGGGEIGFNMEFLENMVDSLMMLGYKEIFAFLTVPSRAIVFSPNKNYRLGEDLICLLMPLMVRGYTGSGDENPTFGALDIDYDYQLKSYYDFSDNEIHNGDGSVADFQLNYGEYDVLSKVDINALKAIKNNVLPILENFISEKGQIYKTDLECSLLISAPHIPDGAYTIINDAVIKATDDTEKEKEILDDYRRTMLVEQEEYRSRVNTSDLLKYMDASEPFIGNDEFRPAMMAWDMDFDNVSLDIMTTNAFSLYYKTGIKSVGDKFRVLVPNVYFTQFKSTLSNSGSDVIIRSGGGRISFSTADYKWSYRLIDEKPLNFKPVIEMEVDSEINLTPEFIDILIKSKSIKSKKNENVVIGCRSNGEVGYVIVDSWTKDSLINFTKLGTAVGVSKKAIKPIEVGTKSCVMMMPYLGNTEKDVLFTLNRDYLINLVNSAKDSKNGVTLVTDKSGNKALFLLEPQMK